MFVQIAMFGRRDSVNTRPSEARAMAGSSMVGTGFTMEGIHNSYVMYDLMSEMSWRTEPVGDLDRWFQVFIKLMHADIRFLSIYFMNSFPSRRMEPGDTAWRMCWWQQH